MAVSISNETRFFLSSTMDAPVKLGGITAASPAVATVLGTGTMPAKDTICLLKTDWADVSEIAVEIGAAGELGGLDATGKTALSDNVVGVGSLTEVTKWQEFEQLMTVDSSGGEMQTKDVIFFGNPMPVSLPLGRQSYSMTMKFADDPSLSSHELMRVQTLKNKKAIIKALLPDGSRTYIYGQLVFSVMPSFQVGEVIEVGATMTISTVNRYPA